MRASTEEFLYVLLWSAESLLRPTWHNLVDDSFESWAWRNGLGRRLAQLERRKLLERQPSADATERVYRLTAEGRITALAGRDPVQRWSRPWDRRWRLVLFDLPTDATALRMKLRRLLCNEHFGYLQNSVWITPDSVEEARNIMRGFPIDPERFVLFEGAPAGGETPASVVLGAWDFAEINRRYGRHLTVVRESPRKLSAHEGQFERLHAWARREQAAWKHAVTLDPLLPLPLLPADYAGRRSWDARCDVLARIAAQLR